MAFKMMRVARAILLDDGTRPKPFATIEDRNLMELYPTNEYLTNEYLKNEYPSPTPFVQQNEGFLEDFPTIQETLEGYNGNMTSRSVPGDHKESIAGAKRLPTKTEDKGDIGRFGLPMNVWRGIIADATGASELLTVEKQMSVLWYASDWQAIKQELRISGGTEFEQIWKILSSMGCLNYAHN
ncbi:hypothetical protein EMCG_00665 [[Emmonsia] crescens]|uniref:Uncharacterized protein n=1 Tax=[Emmonsia] crescens TaxID=73230 RepID=A0A0G2IYV6_9EURO|nr:hypothetical protein EMCG_00665 [Emmonsia crescens UAMH 3008]